MRSVDTQYFSLFTLIFRSKVRTFTKCALNFQRYCLQSRKTMGIKVNGAKNPKGKKGGIAHGTHLSGGG